MAKGRWQRADGKGHVVVWLSFAHLPHLPICLICPFASFARLPHLPFRWDRQGVCHSANRRNPGGNGVFGGEGATLGVRWQYIGVRYRTPGRGFTYVFGHRFNKTAQVRILDAVLISHADLLTLHYLNRNKSCVVFHRVTSHGSWDSHS